MSPTPEELEAEAKSVFEADKAQKARQAESAGWDKPLPHMDMATARLQAGVNLRSRARIRRMVEAERNRLAAGGKPRRSRDLVGLGR